MRTETTGADALDPRQLLVVLNALKKGDFSARMPGDLTGIAGEVADALNDVMKMNGNLSRELNRIATEVGTQGRFGGQAEVEGVSGAWKELTESVNSMAYHLTDQFRDIASVTTSIATGDLTRKITVEAQGEILDLIKTINTMVDQLNSFASEVTRVAMEVGTNGKLGGQAEVKGISGTWSDLTESVNFMASNLTGQVRNIADVTIAVAKGDITRKITVEARGEILELKNTVNTMVDQLNSFASEVTRLAMELGTDGKLGGQVEVHGVSGTWKDLIESLNSMSGNLTSQIRDIARVAAGVAKGDPNQKVTVGARGETLDLKNSINTIVDQLNASVSEGARVGKEAGAEG